MNVREAITGSVAALVAAVVVYQRQWMGQFVLLAVVLVVVAFVVYHDQKSKEFPRPRHHQDVEIVMYEESGEERYGVLGPWWYMQDGSIMMELYPCDVAGNMDNVKPVLVSNTTVKGWWDK